MTNTSITTITAQSFALKMSTLAAPQTKAFSDTHCIQREFYSVIRTHIESGCLQRYVTRREYDMFIFTTREGVMSDEYSLKQFIRNVLITHGFILDELDSRGTPPQKQAFNRMDALKKTTYEFKKAALEFELASITE